MLVGIGQPGNHRRFVEVKDEAREAANLRPSSRCKFRASRQPKTCPRVLHSLRTHKCGIRSGAGLIVVKSQLAVFNAIWLSLNVDRVDTMVCIPAVGHRLDHPPGLHPLAPGRHCVARRVVVP